ncbi:MAG: TraX family protein [Planctomycetota bacterium]
MAPSRKKRPPKRRVAHQSKSPAANALSSESSKQNPTKQRSVTIDALRGLAIVLMIVDHVASNWFSVPIAIDTIRFETRLAMPLFAILLGYFLPLDGGFRLQRLAEVVAASVAVNLLYFPKHDEFEILASLLIASIIGTASRSAAPAMLGLIFLYQTDPLVRWFDYQLSIVLPIVAIGATLRRYGVAASWVAASFLLAITISGKWIYPSDTHRFLVWASLPALLMIVMARRWPAIQPAKVGWLGLDRIGRFPLSIYVAHYYLIYLVAFAM